MIRIMANENFETYNAKPTIRNETIGAVKKYLDGELAKYDTWEDFSVNNSINTKLFTSNREYQNCKKHNGVGQTVITNFLGPPWKQWMVQDALAHLKETEDTREALEQFDSYSDAREFKSVLDLHNR